MDEKRVLDLANRILKYDKKTSEFFNFINEQFPDTRSILGFLEQIDNVLNNTDSLELLNVKYIVIALIEDNSIRERVYK